MRDYSPSGYDERQFNAVGFDLPVGRLTRPHGEYPKYHINGETSLLQMAELAGSDMQVRRAADDLLEAGLPTPRDERCPGSLALRD